MEIDRKDGWEVDCMPAILNSMKLEKPLPLQQPRIRAFHSEQSLFYRSFLTVKNVIKTLKELDFLLLECNKSFQSLEGETTGSNVTKSLAKSL